MPPSSHTLYALSSGRLPAGVAVIRISGPLAFAALTAVAGPLPDPRRASLRRIRDPETGDTLDHGLVLAFPGPRSFTGEDLAEIQVHGGRAVVAAVLKVLERMPGLKPAEAGAFTRRAFENGRIDLTATEGLADLLAAETEAQRRQALRLADGHLMSRATRWRADLLDIWASLEASIDFVEEDDIPDDVGSGFAATVDRIASDMKDALRGTRAAERIRDGFEVALAGPPNAGKSSLLNVLAGRSVAIVSDVAGTTRDVLEVHLDIAGYAVTVVDLAGRRVTDDPVEAEGVRRAEMRVRRADLVLWLDESGAPPPADLTATGPVVPIRTKADLAPGHHGSAPASGFPTRISVRDAKGIDALVTAIGALAALDRDEAGEIVNARQRSHVQSAVDFLRMVNAEQPVEIAASLIRSAADAIGRLTGRIDVEEVLGSIFSRFCVGK